MKYALRALALVATLVFAWLTDLGNPSGLSGWAISLLLVGGFSAVALTLADKSYQRLKGSPY
jgi:hypothetical protein